MSSRPNVYLVMIAVAPGTKPPGRTVRCDQCSHWEGMAKPRAFEVGHRCALLGGLHPADFGCAYFQRRPAG